MALNCDSPKQQKRLGAAERAYIDRDRESEPLTEVVTVPWFKLLGYRQTWAFAVGKFMTGGV